MNLGLNKANPGLAGIRIGLRHMLHNKNDTEKRKTNNNSSRRLKNKAKNNRESDSCITTNKREQISFSGDGN
jgi:hypothetical protein